MSSTPGAQVESWPPAMVGHQNPVALGVDDRLVCIDANRIVRSGRPLSGGAAVPYRMDPCDLNSGLCRDMATGDIWVFGEKEAVLVRDVAGPVARLRYPGVWSAAVDRGEVFGLLYPGDEIFIGRADQGVSTAGGFAPFQAYMMYLDIAVTADHVYASNGVGVTVFPRPRGLEGDPAETCWQYRTSLIKGLLRVGGKVYVIRRNGDVSVVNPPRATDSSISVHTQLRGN